MFTHKYYVHPSLPQQEKGGTKRNRSEKIDPNKSSMQPECPQSTKSYNLITGQIWIGIDFNRKLCEDTSEGKTHGCLMWISLSQIFTLDIQLSYLLNKIPSHASKTLLGLPQPTSYMKIFFMFFFGHFQMAAKSPKNNQQQFRPWIPTYFLFWTTNQTCVIKFRFMWRGFQANALWFFFYNYTWASSSGEMNTMT